MENASKALIIAGAILLSILIIGLGMAVYNNASSSANNANLDAQEISAHNSQFLSYEGKIKGSQVRTLVNAIKQNNTEYTDRLITISWDAASKSAKVNPEDISITKSGVTEDPNTNQYSIINNAIKNNATYYVTFNNREDGLIGGVDIHLYSQVDIK